jgi:hypothetical protein
VNAKFNRRSGSHWPIYPLLIPAAGILRFYESNSGQAMLADTCRPIGVATLISAGLLVAGRMILGSWSKAAMVVALNLVSVFCLIGLHAYGQLAFLVVLGLASIAVAFRSSDCSAATPVMNAMALAITALPMTQILIDSPSVIDRSAFPPLEVGAHSPDQELPDIYFVVLDGYARSDVLARLYGTDNETFLNELETLGFYVARDSRSNYAQTALSLASMMNLEPTGRAAQGSGISSRCSAERLLDHGTALGRLHRRSGRSPLRVRARPHYLQPPQPHRPQVSSRSLRFRI